MPKLTGAMVAECTTWLSIVSQLFGNRMSILLKPHGLTLGQFSILHHITRQKIGTGNRVSDIAAAVEVGQPAVTKALSKFRNMGLVAFGETLTDKRAKTVVALPAAGALLGTIYQDIGPELFRVFSVVDTEALEGFLSQLKVMGHWLDDNRLEPLHKPTSLNNFT